MGRLKKELIGTNQITPKQKLFIDILVENWGNISKSEAYKKAGFECEDTTARVQASVLTNPDKNPHVCRYLEKRLNKELEIYEKDKLRSYKQFEKMRDGAINKNQYNAGITAQRFIGQMAGHFVDRKEINVSGIENMNRNQLEERLKQLEDKINENKAIIDITPDTVIEK
jgi:hypothetical protein